MKRLVGLLFAALLILAATTTRADHTSTTLGPFTEPGPSSVISAAASPPETGAERWSFQTVVVGAITARLEVSNNGGTAWATLHVFDGPSEIFSTPTCGACKLRFLVVNCPAGSSLIIHVAQSGALVPEVTP